MLVQDLLLSTLDNLGNDDFKRFQWHLCQPLDGYEPIPKSHVENTKRQETVDKMMASYCDGPAVTVAVEILKKMNQNYAAVNLENKYKQYTEGRTVEQQPVTSSSALPPSTTGVTISAQNGSVVIAPSFAGATITGPLNMNITN